MLTFNAVRAWKDEDYRLGLSESELALLPENPAGVTDLSDEQLANVNGGITPTVALTVVIACLMHLRWACAPASQSAIVTRKPKTLRIGGRHCFGRRAGCVGP